VKSGDDPALLVVPLKVLPHGRGLALPAYSTPQSVGMDLAAAVEKELTILPGGTALIPTGIKIAVPPGYEAQIRPRSGLALNSALLLPNSPGTVDPDYRGEVQVILLNMGPEPFTVTRGMRIAQMVIAPVAKAHLRLVEELPPTDRGEGGFGHTGT